MEDTIRVDGGVTNTESGETFECAGDFVEPHFGGYLQSSRDDSLTFRNFDGQVRWQIDSGVVGSYDLANLDEGAPWIVVWTNAGEEMVVDPLSGEAVPDTF